MRIRRETQFPVQHAGTVDVPDINRCSARFFITVDTSHPALSNHATVRRLLRELAESREENGAKSGESLAPELPLVGSTFLG